MDREQDDSPSSSSSPMDISEIQIGGVPDQVEVLDSLNCVVDNVMFKCVWKKESHEQLDMALINQFVDELTILDETMRDFSNSDIMKFISASFPSASSFDVPENNGNDEEISEIISSTPSKEVSLDSSLFQKFQATSPIQSPERHSKVVKVKARRFAFFGKPLQLSFDYDIDSEDLPSNNSKVKRSVKEDEK